MRAPFFPRLRRDAFDMTACWRRVTRAIAAVTLVLLLHAPSSQAKPYHNPEFGIDVELPNDLPANDGSGDGHDHGPVICLDADDAQECSEAEHRRFIGISGWFNVLDEMETLEDYLHWTCTKLLKGRCVPAPRGLRIGAGPNAVARVNHANGWIDIDVLTQGGRAPDQAADDPTGAVNYSAWLHTDRAHMKADFRRFKSVLRSVRLTPLE